MKIFRQIAVAFSLYSRIPMPLFEWDESDYKYNLVFLPFVGGIIALVTWLVYKGMAYLGIPLLGHVLFLIAVPIIITGGFHIDGFMDVSDALSSYASAEKKLEILKDPHIGAFAVIALIKAGLVYAGSFAVILGNSETVCRNINLLALSFILSRTLCGIISLTFRHAKKEGMLNMETRTADRREIIILAIETALCFGAMCYMDILLTCFITVILVLYILYYRYKCYKNFGGITGDMAGYFIVVSEVLMATCIAISTVIK